MRENAEQKKFRIWTLAVYALYITDFFIFKFKHVRILFKYESYFLWKTSVETTSLVFFHTSQLS